MSYKISCSFILLNIAVLFFSAFVRADEPTSAAQDKQAYRQAIQKALTKQVDWDFVHTPLAEVVEKLQDELKIPILLDHKALSDLGVTPDTAVTFKISGISAKSALSLMLRDFGLTTLIRYEVLLITSPDFADSHLLTRSYDVSDLPSFRTKDGKVVPDYDKLIETITKTIGPTTWDEVGGPASITPADAEGIQALVVSQTLQLHEEIGQLLDNLRKQRKTPLMKEALEKLPPPPEPQPRIPGEGMMSMPGNKVPTVKRLPLLEPDPARDAVVQANNQFAFDLYRQLREKDRNLFFSPYSIATVLAMARSVLTATLAKVGFDVPLCTFR